MAEPNMINPFEEDIKANEAEAAAIAQEFQPEPYAQTRLAQQEEMKSWRQMLIDSHKKREEERTKRLRSEQILGIGKALGDLLGAAFAGAGSTRGNYAAVVPQAQAPKSVERVQQLINEGVVNAKDYDKMMQTLAMQEGKDRIALAKAMDEIGIKQSQLAEQREYEQQKAKVAHERQKEYEQQKAKVAHERQKELIGIRHTNTVTQLAQRGRNAVAAAQARGAKGGRGVKNNYSDADLAIIGVALPKFVNETTEKPNKYGEMETVTKKKPYKPTDNDIAVELARQKELMKRYKLDPNSEEDKQKWATIVSNHNILIAALPDVAQEKIMAALLAGYTGEEILAHFKK